MAGLLLVVFPAHAAENPGQVDVGVYVNNVQELSFKDGRLRIDFYIWFSWTPAGALEKYDPIKSMEVINGTFINDDKSSEVRKAGKEGRKYASVRINAIVYKNWDLEAFPFDVHRIEVNVEDSELNADALKFKPDGTNSKLGNPNVLPGWHLDGFFINARPQTYDTNFGDPDSTNQASSDWSRLTFSLCMKRDGPHTPIKLLSLVIIATLLAFTAFFIRPTDVDPRFGLGVGALFAVAASGFVVASNVPDSSVLTIADKIHLVAMWLIFATVVQSTICLKWCERGDRIGWKRMNSWSIVVFPLVFAVLTFLLIKSAPHFGDAPCERIQQGWKTAQYVAR